MDELAKKGTLTKNEKPFKGSFSGHEEWSLFLRNHKTGEFFDAPFLLGLDKIEDGRALVSADFNNDGFLDLISNTQQGIRLFFNPGLKKENNFVFCSFTPETNLARILNSRVQVKTAHGEQVRVFLATQGFFSQVPRTLHFGLGKDTKVKSLKLEYFKDGSEKSYSDLKGNYQYTFNEKGELVGQKEVKKRNDFAFVSCSRTNPDKKADKDFFHLYAFFLRGLPFSMRGAKQSTLKIHSFQGPNTFSRCKPFVLKNAEALRLGRAQSLVILYSKEGKLIQAWVNLKNANFLPMILSYPERNPGKIMIDDKGLIERSIRSGRYWNLNEAIWVHERLKIISPQNLSNGLYLLSLYKKMGKKQAFSQLLKMLLQVYPKEPELLKLQQTAL
ncbi:CRTAC1 family protein [Candidatus Riflebacteria bacterium]